MDESEFLDMFFMWVDKLELSSWKIEVTYSDAEMPECGTCDINLPRKYAEVAIHDINDKEFWEENGPIEMTVAHELLHIHLDPISRKLPNEFQWLEEHFIDLISKLLVE